MAKGLISAALGLLISSHALTPQQTPKTTAATELFELYQSRQFSVVRQRVLSAPDTVSLVADIRRTSRSPELKAGLLLEACAALLEEELRPVPAWTGAYNVLQQGKGPLAQTQRFAAVVKEAVAAEDVVPRGSAVDQQWNDAALALLEGSVEAPSHHLKPGAGGRVLESFLDQREGRIDPGRAALGRALVYEASVWTIVSYEVPTLLGYNPKDVPLFAAEVHGGLQREVNAAIARLERARTFAQVRAEAQVRLAVMLDLRGKNDDRSRALELLLQPISEGASADMQYIKGIATARALLAAGRQQEAESAFQDALKIRTDSQAARLGVAIAAFRSGREPQDVDMWSPPNTPDPWVYFRYGEYRDWPKRLSVLREAILR